MSIEERSAFIRAACGSDETLISQVMLALDEEAAEPAPAQYSTPQSWENERLGPYRILRLLGSGGMGEVYLAERADEEYQQRVAIKVVRNTAFSSQIQARLRMERQILASLQHPNIARLLDGGRAPDGRPYLVMEYIEGEAIDAYCDRHRLDVDARIEIIRTVCSAVHYAHQNLVVHRDLKPNNILIMADGTPKLLDFGIAKLLETRHSPQTLAVTHMDYRMMTPAHASPEQVRGEVITTASDIYVLGVLVYELLCGRKPYDLVGTRLSELERIVCEQDPVPPSARLARTASESPHYADEIAACRAATVPRLIKKLRGDLDNITLMAMRREATRRYGSAQELANDLAHHRNGMPVLAAPDRWSYRTLKFVRRNALGVSFAATAVILLMLFAIITSIQANHVRRERDVAAAERLRAEQVSSFLVELFELSDPSHSRGNEVTARELLDVGAHRISSGLDGEPRTRALLLGTIGRVYSSLGLYAESVQMLEETVAARTRLYGPQHLEVADARSQLGEALLHQDKFDRAQKELQAALELQTKLAGATAIDVAPTLGRLAHLAELRGLFDAAQKLYEESMRIYRLHGRERDPEATSLLSDMAGLYVYRGDYAQGERLYRSALNTAREKLGSDHPQVAAQSVNLAATLQAQGKLEEAGPLFVDALHIFDKVLGPTHPSSLDARANYGRYLQQRGDYAAAGNVFAEVLAADQRIRGAQHAFVGHDHVNLGLALLDQNKPAAAREHFQAALDIYQAALPSDHPFVASALSGLGQSLSMEGQFAAAEKHLRRATEIASRSLPANSPQLATARSELGIALLGQHRVADATPLLQQSYSILAQRPNISQRILNRAKEARSTLQ
ncbi:MAG TPA: serine/threonine-protein kinase [Steroidobacteraceae bacterium]|nr:serine/threonine-protein kinase [Steroidobacteraceae bacterium]